MHKWKLNWKRSARVEGKSVYLTNWHLSMRVSSTVLGSNSSMF